MQTVTIARNIVEQTSAEIVDEILKETGIKPMSKPVISISGGQGQESLKMRRSLYSTIGQLSKSGYCFPPHERTESIYEKMKINPAITEFTVVENDTAVGFLTRTALNETLGGKYGFTLHSENPIQNIMDHIFLKVDYDMPIDKASKIAMQRPFEQLYNPIVVERNGKYSGIVTVKDLLDISTKIALAERDEIALMKDSLEIGFFFMDSNCIIQSHYSRFLDEMLSEKDLSGKYFPGLLSASFTAKEQESVTDYFEMIFQRAYDQGTLNDINPLSEFTYVNAKTGKKKVFHCDFLAVERDHHQGEVFVLVTIYDISAKTELQRQLREEENRRQEEMQAVFELIQVEPGVFKDFLEDAEYEFDRIQKNLRNADLPTHKVLVEVYQSIHAIKSNAVILGLTIFGNKAHELEEKIKKMRESAEKVSFDNMLNLSINIEKLYEEKENFKITTKKIQAFNKSGNAGRKQGRDVLIESFAKTAQKAADDLGKKVQFVVDGIDTKALEHGPRRIMKEVVMQLIRNSVVHGIETPEERLAGEKDETGVIRLSIRLLDNKIHLILGDNGSGLNFGKIAQKALELKLIKKEEVKSKNALIKVIFSPGFSTSETEGIHAGRGIGLNLVQDRVRDGKGTIKVQTESGKGTIFNIYFPAA
jgi:two-component system chemotaxis sensor kinase CheA